MSDPIVINEALELKPGSIYAIKSEQRLSRDEYSSLMDQFEKLRDRLGVEFIILDGSLHIVREVEQP